VITLNILKMSEQDNLQNADGKEENTDRLESSKTAEPQQEKKNENSSNEADVDAVLNEIDASNAEDAEDEDNSERHSIELKDYPELSLDELVIELEQLLKNHKVQAIKKNKLKALKTNLMTNLTPY